MTPSAIILPLDRVSEVLNYDPATGIFTWTNKASRLRGRVAGRLGQDGYIVIRIDGTHVRAHRLAWAIHFSEWPSIQIDHINRIKTDNRIENLRLATQSQNNANRGHMPCNSHGDKGVTRLPSGSWQAQIQVNKKNHYLGAFKEKSEAMAAYAAAALQHFGSFAHVEVCHG